MVRSLLESGRSHNMGTGSPRVLGRSHPTLKLGRSCRTVMGSPQNRGSQWNKTGEDLLMGSRRERNSAGRDQTGAAQQAGSQWEEIREAAQQDLDGRRPKRSRGAQREEPHGPHKKRRDALERPLGGQGRDGRASHKRGGWWWQWQQKFEALRKTLHVQGVGGVLEGLPQ